MPLNLVRDGQLDIESLVAEAQRILQLFVKQTRLDLRYEIHRGPAAQPADSGGEPQPAVQIIFSGPDEDILLTHNAETLLALEHILHRWLGLPPNFHDDVRLDCAGWRAQRLEELRLSAKVAAQRVRETGQPFPLNFMSARERRVVHLALAGAAGVRTSSEGMGDRRQVVIYPVKEK